MAQLLKRSRRKNKKLVEAAKLRASGLLRIPSSDEPEPDKKIDEALAALGLVIETEEEIEETFALWPECCETFFFWLKIQTQWVRDMNGNPERLDYQAVDVVMKWEGIPAKKRKELSNEIRAMEISILNMTHET